MHHEIPVGAHMHCSSKLYRFQSLRGALECSSLSQSLTARSSRPVIDTKMLQKMLTQSVAAGPSDINLPNGKFPSVWHRADGNSGSGKVDWKTSSSACVAQAAFHFTSTYSQSNNYDTVSLHHRGHVTSLLKKTGFKALDHRSSSPSSSTPLFLE